MYVVRAKDAKNVAHLWLNLPWPFSKRGFASKGKKIPELFFRAHGVDV